MRAKQPALAFLIIIVACVSDRAAKAGQAEDTLRSVIPELCENGLSQPSRIGKRINAETVEDVRPAHLRWTLPNGLRVEIAHRHAGRPNRLFVLTASRELDDGAQRPLISLRINSECKVTFARELIYDIEGRIQSLVHLDHPDRLTEPLNPTIPEGADPGGVTLAHIDSGVNYLLPHIKARLARDGDGRFLGYDYWDLDGRPFDSNPVRSPFFPLRHGSAVASVLIREAPEVRLIPYRYPRPDMTRMKDVVAAAIEAGARIVLSPMGSRSVNHWRAFQKAAKAHPDILFLVSAGNDGRDIDAFPLYPASLDLANMLVVTSSDSFGRLAEGSNWGAKSVDIMVPGERIEVIDHRGATLSASGASYALPRIGALAVRLLQQNPGWTAENLIEAIKSHAAPPRHRGAPVVRFGWIPNPVNVF